MSDPRSIRTFGDNPPSPTGSNTDEPPTKRQRLDNGSPRDDLFQLNIDRLLASAEETDEVADVKRALIRRITHDPRYQFFVDVVGASGRGGPVDPMNVFDTTNMRALLAELSEKIGRLSQGRSLVVSLTREMQRIELERPRLEQELLTTRLQYAEVETKSQDVLRKNKKSVLALNEKSQRLKELKRVGQPAITWWNALMEEIRARELLKSIQTTPGGLRKAPTGSLGAFMSSMAASQKSETYTAHTNKIVQEFINLVAVESKTSWLQTLNVEAFYKTPLGIKIIEIYSRQFGVSFQSIREDDRPIAIAEVMLDLVMGFIMPAAPTLDHPNLFISTPFPLFMDYKIFSATLNEPFRSALGKKGSEELVKLVPSLLKTYSQLYQKITPAGVDEKNKFELLFELYNQVPLKQRQRGRQPPTQSTVQDNAPIEEAFPKPTEKPNRRNVPVPQVQQQVGKKSSGNTTIDESATDERSSIRFRDNARLPLSAGKLANTGTNKQRATQKLKEKREPRYIERLETAVPNARQLFPWIQVFEGISELGYDDDKAEEAAVDFTLFAHCLQEALLRLIDVDAPSRRSRNILNVYLASIPEAAHLKFLKDIVTNVAILIDDNVLYLKSIPGNPAPTSNGIRQPRLETLTEAQLCEALLRDILAWSKELQAIDIEPIVPTSVPSAWLNHHRKNLKGIRIAEFIRAWHAEMSDLTGREANDPQPIPRTDWNWTKHAAATTPGKDDPDYADPFVSEQIVFDETFGQFVNQQRSEDQAVIDYQTRLATLFESGGNVNSSFNKLAVASREIDTYVDSLNQLSIEEAKRISRGIEDLEAQLASVTQAAGGVSDDDEQDYANGGDDDNNDDMDVVAPPDRSPSRPIRSAFQTPRGKRDAHAADIEIKLEQVNTFVNTTRTRIESIKRAINTGPLIPMTNASVAISQSFAYLRSKAGGERWCDIVRSPDNLIVSRNEEARRLFATLVRDHMTNSEQRSGARALYQQRTYYDVVFIDKDVVAERLLAISPELAGKGGTFLNFRF